MQPVSVAAFDDKFAATGPLDDFLGDTGTFAFDLLVKGFDPGDRDQKVRCAGAQVLDGGIIPFMEVSLNSHSLTKKDGLCSTRAPTQPF